MSSSKYPGLHNLPSNVKSEVVKKLNTFSTSQLSQVSKLNRNSTRARLKSMFEKQYLNNTKEIQEILISKAVKQGKKEAFKKIIMLKPEFKDMRTSSRKPLIHLVTQFGHKDLVEFLIKQGVKKNTTWRDPAGHMNDNQTLLYTAIKYKQFSIAKMLLNEYNASLNNNSYNLAVRKKLVKELGYTPLGFRSRRRGPQNKN